jgi:hypothetical protein
MNIIPLTCSCSVGCFVQSRQPNNDDILFCLLCIESHPRLSQEKFIPCFQCPTNPDLCFLRKRPFSFSSQITAAKKNLFTSNSPPPRSPPQDPTLPQLDASHGGSAGGGGHCPAPPPIPPPTSPPETPPSPPPPVHPDLPAAPPHPSPLPAPRCHSRLRQQWRVGR